MDSREILYLYTSQTGNNGSAFGGITGNTLWYNTTGGLAMLIGRYFVIIPADGDRRLAGSEEDPYRHRPAPSRLMADSSSVLLVGVIVIVGGLTFFPALALGPVVEQFAMQAHTLF